jgi:hypothetical protein
MSACKPFNIFIVNYNEQKKNTWHKLVLKSWINLWRGKKRKKEKSMDENLMYPFSLHHKIATLNVTQNYFNVVIRWPLFLVISIRSFYTYIYLRHLTSRFIFSIFSGDAADTYLMKQGDLISRLTC